MAPSTPNRLPFQTKATRLAIEKKKVLINYPAGSGKSLIALDTAVESGCKRVLVVCPAFLRLNWMYELNKWFPGHWNVFTVNNVEDAKDTKDFKQIFAIVGYSFFQKKGNVKLLQNQHWDMVICDESHYLRKWDSRRCKDVVVKIARLRDRLLFLSATPLVTSAADLHPTFAVMQPGLWGNYGDFKETYCNKVPDFFNPQGFRYVGIKRAEELRTRARDFVLTAKKEVILSELPPKRIIDVPVAVGKCKVFDADTVSEMLDQIAEGYDEDDDIKTERERIGKLKVKDTMELLDTIPKNEPVVIFAWHRSVVEEIYNKLIADEQKADYIMGGLNEKVRMERVEAFRSGEIKRLVVSIAAGGLGLNLQVASIGIFAELPYTHAEFEQCSDRIHRIGSARRVRLYKLIAVNSIDETINTAISDKRNFAEQAGVLT